MKELIERLEKLPEVQEGMSLEQLYKDWLPSIKGRTGSPAEITGTHDGCALMLGLVLYDNNHPLRTALPRPELIKLEEALGVAQRKIHEMMRPDNKGVYGKFYARIINAT